MKSAHSEMFKARSATLAECKSSLASMAPVEHDMYRPRGVGMVAEALDGGYAHEYARSTELCLSEAKAGKKSGFFGRLGSMFSGMRGSSSEAQEARSAPPPPMRSRSMMADAPPPPMAAPAASSYNRIEEDVISYEQVARCAQKSSYRC